MPLRIRRVQFYIAHIFWCMTIHSAKTQVIYRTYGYEFNVQRRISDKILLVCMINDGNEVMCLNNCYKLLLPCLKTGVITDSKGNFSSNRIIISHNVTCYILLGSVCRILINTGRFTLFQFFISNLYFRSSNLRH